MLCYLLSSFPEPPSLLAELVWQLVADQAKPLVAYLPAGNIERHYVREVKTLLRNVAQVGAVKPELHSLKRIQGILDQASLLLIPGGNTYLMAHRLHQIGIVAGLAQRLLDGLPLVTISAGTVFCGQDILTTNDINCCGCLQFNGLKLAGCNFNVHYPALPGAERDERDERLGEYLAFHDRPIVALQDGACLRITQDGLDLLGGVAWRFEGGRKVMIESLDQAADFGM